MINKEAVEQIRLLEKEYEKCFGVKVNYGSTVPEGLTQEKLVEVLKIMIETGDSILVAYSKYKNR